MKMILEKRWACCADWGGQMFDESETEKKEATSGAQS